MILNGKIVNRPSFNGQERPIAGAFIITYRNNAAEEAGQE